MSHFLFVSLRRLLPDALSSSSGMDMARRPHAPSRNGASGQCHREPSTDEVARPVVDEYPLNDDDLAEAALEDDDDLREDVAVLFGVDVGDDNVQHNNIIDVDVEVGDSGGGVTTGTKISSTSTHGTTSYGKRKSSVWDDFEGIKEGGVRITAICKMCRTRLIVICYWSFA